MDVAPTHDVHSGLGSGPHGTYCVRAATLRQRDLVDVLAQWIRTVGDNRDGKLAGTEISGNGISDPGEVVPAEQFGIAEIAVRGRGITLRDGTVLPMFDWVPQGSHKRSY
jgi:hypothetical protein